MADNLATVWETQILDNIMNSNNSGNYTKPTVIYVGLATGTCNGITFPEVAQASYSRVPLTFGTAASATAGTISIATITGPTASVTFPMATASWGTIEAYGLFKASSGSTGASQYLVYGVVSPTVAVTTNDTVSFAAGAMTLTMG